MGTSKGYKPKKTFRFFVGATEIDYPVIENHKEQLRFIQFLQIELAKRDSQIFILKEHLKAISKVSGVSYER